MKSGARLTTEFTLSWHNRFPAPGCHGNRVAAARPSQASQENGRAGRRPTEFLPGLDAPD